MATFGGMTFGRYGKVAFIEGLKVKFRLIYMADGRFTKIFIKHFTVITCALLAGSPCGRRYGAPLVSSRYSIIAS